MSLLFYCAGDDDGHMLAAIRASLPNADIRVWPERGDPASITAAIAWQPPADFFDGLGNLRYVLSVAAGVEKLLDHPGLAADIPVIRLSDAGMGEQMAEYVLYGVLHAHRRMPAFREAQQAHRWTREAHSCAAKEFTVGILGSGALGKVVCNRLRMNGYAVSCWSRTPKTIEGVKHYSGREAMPEFLGSLKALVCLLPLTEATTGILDQTLFSQLPRGAFLINPARGGHLVDADLLQAIESGQLSGALLDVFHAEPLPQDHAFWANERIIITPHLAAPCLPIESAAQIAESLELLERGERPAGWVEREKGY